MARESKKPSKEPTGGYAVGYARPPEHSRFKPGQSGNPKGRPAGPTNMVTLIEEALKEKVVITEGGRRRSISKGKAIAKQLVNKAASGDLRATRLLLPHQKVTAAKSQQIEPHTTTNASAPSSPTASIDYSKLTTAEMETLYEAALIIEGQGKQRPPPSVPPGDQANVRPKTTMSPVSNGVSGGLQECSEDPTTEE